MQVTIIPKFPDDCEQWYSWVPELRGYQGRTGELIGPDSDGDMEIQFPPESWTWFFPPDWVVQKPYTPGVWYPWDPEEAKKHSQLLIYGSVINPEFFREIMQAYKRVDGAWEDAQGETIVNPIKFLIIPKVPE